MSNGYAELSETQDDENHPEEQYRLRKQLADRQNEITLLRTRINELENANRRRKAEEKKEEEKEEEYSEIDVDALLEPILPSDDLLNSKEKYTEKLLSNLASEFEIVQGVVFLLDPKEDHFEPAGKYAYFNEEPPKAFKTGETLPGQVARNKQLIVIDDIPEGYVQVVSGLGTSSPKHLLIFPVLNDDKVVGIVEMASFKTFDKKIEAVIPKLSEKLNTSFSSLIKE